MKTVYLISCVKKKCGLQVPAEHLYCSDWFKKARAYVLRKIAAGDKWYILSAKHGLLAPDEHVGPYNETLTNMKKAKRQAWTRQIMGDISQVLAPGDTVVLLAGQKYREFLEIDLHSLGCRVSVPMRGMGIGKQQMA